VRDHSGIHTGTLRHVPINQSRTQHRENPEISGQVCKYIQICVCVCVCECERLARIDTLRWGSSRHGKTFLALTGKRKVVASVCLCPHAAAATRHHAEHAEHAEGHRHSTCTPPTAALSRSIA